MSFKKPAYTKAIWPLFSNSDLPREITLQVEHSTTPILNRRCGGAMISSSHGQTFPLSIAMASARVRTGVSVGKAILRNPLLTSLAGAPAPAVVKPTPPVVKLTPPTVKIVPFAVKYRLHSGRSNTISAKPGMSTVALSFLPQNLTVPRIFCLPFRWHTECLSVDRVRKDVVRKKVVSEMQRSVNRSGDVRINVDQSSKENHMKSGKFQPAMLTALALFLFSATSVAAVAKTAAIGALESAFTINAVAECSFANGIGAGERGGWASANMARGSTEAARLAGASEVAEAALASQGAASAITCAPHGADPAEVQASATAEAPA